MSIQSRITRGIGFGALAVATLGFIAQVEQPAAPPPSYGGGGWVAPPNNYAKPKEANLQQIKFIAQQHAEDEAMLHIIMNAVTQELLT